MNKPMSMAGRSLPQVRKENPRGPLGKVRSAANSLRRTRKTIGCSGAPTPRSRAAMARPSPKWPRRDSNPQGLTPPLDCKGHSPGNAITRNTRFPTTSANRISGNPPESAPAGVEAWKTSPGNKISSAPSLDRIHRNVIPFPAGARRISGPVDLQAVRASCPLFPAIVAR